MWGATMPLRTCSTGASRRRPPTRAGNGGVMAIPSPSRLERFLSPYACGGSLHVRVWGGEAVRARVLPLTREGVLFGGPPRLPCRGATETGLVVVRQTCDGYEDLDGSLVPWPHVARLERDPHLVRDVVTVEVRGRDAF